jgi:nucleoside phosphorylase
MAVASGLVQHDMDASPLFPRHEVPHQRGSQPLQPGHLVAVVGQSPKRLSPLYLSQPRRRKYHMGTTALAAMRAKA